MVEKSNIKSFRLSSTVCDIYKSSCIISSCVVLRSILCNCNSDPNREQLVIVNPYSSSVDVISMLPYMMVTFIASNTLVSRSAIWMSGCPLDVASPPLIPAFNVANVIYLDKVKVELTSFVDHFN